MVTSLNVDLGDRSYPVYVGANLLAQSGATFIDHHIPKTSPVLIVSDENVAPLYLNELSQSLERAGYDVCESIVPAGEKSKSLDVLQDIVTAALHGGLDRQSTIVALGGGVIGDLAGFAAASFMRGVRFVQVPTTILAHDSSVGGKVAVNHPMGKNIIGAFHQPALVLFDTDTLNSLPEREIKGGLAEVIKHGLIWDANFVEWVDEHAERLLSLDPESLQYALSKGIQIKANVVSQDEREQGLRAILNLGHTIGHALEAVSHYDELVHGEAIAIGMVGAAMLSKKLDYSETIYTETERLLSKFGLPIRIPKHLDVKDIMAAMMNDKKFTAGQLNFIVATAIGQVEIRKNIQASWVEEILKHLQN